MKNLLILLLLTFSVSSIQSQTLRQYKKKAVKEYQHGNLYGALHFYKIAMDLDEENFDLKYSYANIAREYSAYSLSEKYYMSVLTSEKAKNFPQTNYWLGVVRKFQGKYTESKSAFEKFIQIGSVEDSLFVDKAKIELSYLDWAIDIVAEKKGDVEIRHLGEGINTFQSEHSPYLIDSTIYFTSYGYENTENSIARDQPFSIIKNSKNERMSEMVKVDSDFMKKSGHLTFSPDHKEVYFTLCKQKRVSDIICKIYSGKLNDAGELIDAKELPSSINLEGYTTTQPTLGYDNEVQKNVLYFVSNRPLGKGGKDIWSVEVLGNNQYSTPVNLGDINTTNDEISPFFHSGTQTLFFSSNGYKNLGGFDIYKIKKTGMDWGERTHLGYPINSSYNDMDFFITERQDKALFASNRKGSLYLEEEKEACCNDIFEADLIPPFVDVLVTTFDGVSKDKLNGVTVRMLKMKNEIDSQMHPDDNEYTFTPDRGYEYLFIGSKPGYYDDTVRISVIDYDKLDPLKVELFLKKKKVDLTAFVFDINNDIPLKECTMTLFDCEGNQLAQNKNHLGHKFNFPLETNSCYKLKVEREGYFPKTIEFKTDDSEEPIIKNIKLKPRPVIKKSLDKYLPMPMYFDNDEPDNSTLATTTLLTYEDTYQKYMLRKEEFAKQYSKGLVGDKKNIAASRAYSFFEEDVTDGYKFFNKFTEYLLIFLEQGNDAQLMFKGYASPRASKKYNEALTKRRISCVRNHFMNYKNGVFNKFIESGKLVITEVPFGESEAKADVSDDLYDKRNSIYSPEASKERRLEIIEIK